MVTLEFCEYLGELPWPLLPVLPLRLRGVPSPRLRAPPLWSARRRSERISAERKAQSKTKDGPALMTSHMVLRYVRSYLVTSGHGIGTFKTRPRPRRTPTALIWSLNGMRKYSWESVSKKVWESTEKFEKVSETLHTTSHWKCSKPLFCFAIHKFVYCFK